jgi:hypothetical protein
MAEYTILIPHHQASWEAPAEEERAETYRQHAAFAQALAERGHKILKGAELHEAPAARTVRRGADGSAVVTDGPYAEGVEHLGGYYSIETDDLDDLLQACAILAESKWGVEVRPVVDHGGGSD